MNDLSLLVILIPFGQARKITGYAKKNGLTGATIVIALGTVKSRVLDFLGIRETRKELILAAGSGEFLDDVMMKLEKKFNITRKNFGIAFQMPISYINRSISRKENTQDFTQKEIGTMKSAIFTVVNRGKAEEVVEASIEAGARGGTIINARGSGLNQTKLIFDMEIEPEKEIVLTIVDNNQLEAVMQAIRTKSDVEKDGHGILFVIPVTKSYGIK